VKDFRTRTLLVTTTVAEGIVGIALLVVPSRVVSALLGSSLDEPAGKIAAQLAGSALVALAVACWFASREVRRPVASGLIAGMLCYNLAASGLLLMARFRLGMESAALLPAAALHVALAAWCIACMRANAEDE
jgi:hypothetical protein